MHPFVEFLYRLVTADFSFPEMTGGIGWLVSDISASPHINAWWGGIKSAFAGIEAVIPFIILALALVILFVGKRLFLFIRCLAFFVFGFVIGVYLLAPYVLVVIPTLPTWFIGLIIGIVSAVLSRLLYIVLYAFVPGYVMFALFSGSTIPALDGMYIAGIIAAIVIIVLVFLLRKYVEMLGTAMLGGYMIALVLRGWYDFTAWSIFAGHAWLAMLIVVAIFAPIGFVVQFKTRKRY